MNGLVFATTLPWLLIAFGVWLIYQQFRQGGRILLRLDLIEERLGNHPATEHRMPAGLPLGSIAPDFDLPDLDGAIHKLSQFRGNDVLIIFFSPNCGFCTQMGAKLAALPKDGGDGRPIPIIVTNGDLDENRKLVEQFGIRTVVLLQEKMNTAALYRAEGTPMGYRIDAEGR